jgi:hypothetical protein
VSAEEGCNAVLAAAEAAVSAADGCDEVPAAADCDEELPAASPDACYSSVPVNATASQHTTAVSPAGWAVLDSSTSAATAAQPSTSPASQQLEEAVGLAAAAGAFAAASQPYSGSNTLRRGAGLLVMLRNGWRGKARPLNGSVLVRDVMMMSGMWRSATTALCS